MGRCDKGERAGYDSSQKVAQSVLHVRSTRAVCIVLCQGAVSRMERQIGIMFKYLFLFFLNDLYLFHIL